MTKDNHKIYHPRLGWYRKIDLNKGAPQFTGTPKDIILAYKHWIIVAKKNLGKLTIDDVELTVQIVNLMTIRMKELIGAYEKNSNQLKIDKLNAMADEHWTKIHADNNYKISENGGINEQA